MRSFPKHRRLGPISPQGGLPITLQCELLDIPRSGFYYEPKGESGQNLHLMKLIDRFHLEHPEWGRPKMTHNLRRASRLMRLMNIRSAASRPNTSVPNEAHEISPYLCRAVMVECQI